MYGVLSPLECNIKIGSIQTFANVLYYPLGNEYLDNWELRIFDIKIYELDKITLCNMNFCEVGIFLYAEQYQNLWSI